MPDHWAFVLGAYGLAAVVFVAYWRRLIHRERELSVLTRASRTAGHGSAARRDGTSRVSSA